MCSAFGDPLPGQEPIRTWFCLTNSENGMPYASFAAQAFASASYASPVSLLPEIELAERPMRSYTRCFPDEASCLIVLKNHDT